MGETVPRAFELPVHRAERLDGTLCWDMLRTCWNHSTALANWCVQQLQLHDARNGACRIPGMEFRDFPRFTSPDLYALVFGRAKVKPSRKEGRSDLPIVQPQYAGWEFFRGATQTVCCITNQVKNKYVKERGKVLWFREGSISNYRHPYPWPTHGQSWKHAGFDKGKPYVICALPGGQVKLSLRGSPEFGRQLYQFRQVVKGDLPRKQLVIRAQPCSDGCHRPTITLHGEPYRVMLKMVADLPVRERTGDRPMVLLTDPHAFWVAELDGRQAWVLNADHIRRGVATHQRHLTVLQRLSQDGKAERRMGSNRATKHMNRLKSLCQKDQRQLDSWTHETAAHLLGFARRQGVGLLLYLDRDTGFIPKFPWRSLTDKLHQKCQATEIGFYSESGIGSLPVSDMGGDGDIDLSRWETDEIDEKENERWIRLTDLYRIAGAKLSAGQWRQASHPEVSVPLGS